MILSKEALSEIAFGCIETTEDPDGFFSFHRLTKHQRDHLDRRGFTPRQYATAGVFLEVHGAVKRLSFSYDLSLGSSRIYPYADVCENGKLKKTVTFVMSPLT